MSEKPTYEELEERIKELETKLSADDVDKKRKDYFLDKNGTGILSALMNHTSDYILVCDEEGNSLVFNEAYALLIKKALNIDMKPGVLPHKLLQDSESIKYWENLRRRALQGEQFRAEYTHNFAEDDSRTFEVSYNPIYKDNKFKGFIEITRDISDRKREQVERAHILARLQTTLDATADGILVVNREGKIVTYNKRFVKFWGIPNEILETCDDDKALFHVLNKLEDPENFLSKVRHLYDNPKEKSFDTIKFKDGRIFERYSRPHMLNGEIVGRVWSFRDVSERKQSEQALIESEEKYRYLVEHAPTGIYDIDFLNDKFTSINDAMSLSTGYSKEELLLMNVSSILTKASKEKFFNRIKQASEGKKVPETVELEIMMKDGTTRWASLSTNYKYQNNRPVGASVIAHDITDRKRAEEALRESERKYRFLFENVEMGIGISDESGHVLEMNKAMARIMGYTLEELSKINLSEIYLNPEDRKRFLEKIHQNGKVENYEVRLRHKEGGVQWVNLSGRMIEYEGKDSLLVTALNITENKRSEKALQDSEERFRALVEQSPLGIALIGKDGQYKYINSQFKSIFGYDTEDIPTGADWFRCAFPEKGDRAVAIQTWIDDQNEAGVGQARPRIFKVTCKDGTQKEIAFRPVTLENLDQFVIYEDITERLQADRALQENEARLRSIFRASPNGIGTVSNRVLLDINNRLCEMIGYTQDELVGKDARILYPTDEDYEYVGKEKYRQIRQKGLGTVETRFKHKDGKILNVLMSSAPIDPSDLTAGVSFSVLDITERKKAELERERLQKQLAQSQKMESVGRLAGGVAHDFNNMLGVIIGHTELAMEQVVPESPLRADLEEIQKAAQRSADLTRQLLAFARRQTATPRVLDLNDTLTGMLKMLRRLIGEDIELTWIPGGNLWPVKIDPAQIDQILANLCINARDAIGGVGKIIIETTNVSLDEAFSKNHAGSKPGQHVMLSVSDDGHGMDKKTLANIFEPFFTTKDVGEGTGLGLATVYGTIKQNNGYINVYSEPEKGTTFKIYLPRTTETKTKETPVFSEISGGNETVLLAEDEASVLRLAKTALERFGYSVLAARTPSEALIFAEQHEGPIHLLVTDVVMPEMNGKDLNEQVEKVKPGIKVLFISGYTANVIVNKGLLEEDTNFLQKPFTINALAGKVREMLDKEQ